MLAPTMQHKSLKVGSTLVSLNITSNTRGIRMTGGVFFFANEYNCSKVLNIKLFTYQKRRLTITLIVYLVYLVHLNKDFLN